jgi:hypothetical protein
MSLLPPDFHERAKKVMKGREAAIDAFNAALRDLESNLVAEGYKAPASVPFPSEADPGRTLRWGKSNSNGWGITLDLPGRDRTPLANASLGIRLEAVEHLPALMAAVSDAVERQMDECALAATRVRELTDALRDGRTG